MVVTLVACLGLALRLWGLGRAPIVSDQAVVALMAHEILRGHFFAFFWGQRYGGAEAYVVAVVFAVAGQSTFTLGLAPLLLDAIAALLVWRIGRYLFTPAVGVGAALLFWTWPEVFVQLATIEYGFRWLALSCGLVVLLEVLRVTEQRPRRAPLALDWAVLGLAFGVGWWCTPEVLYYYVPAIGLLVLRSARGSLQGRWRHLAIGILFAGIGALPWIWANVRNGFRSIHEHNQALSSHEAYFRSFFTHTLPLLLGLQLRISGDWVTNRALCVALYLAALVGLASILVWLVLRRRALVLVAFCVLFPFGYAIAPTRNWADGRYAAYLSPVLALLVCAVAAALWRRRPAIPLGAAVVVGFGLTFGAMVQVAPYRPSSLVSSERTWTTWSPDPTSWLQPVITDLHHQGISAVWAGYWSGTVLDFESHATITTSDLPSVRYRPYTNYVLSSARTAWLFLAPGKAAVARAWASTALVDPGCILDRRPCLGPAKLEAYLHSTADPYRVVDVGDFVEIIPAGPVSAQRLLRYWR